MVHHLKQSMEEHLSAIFLISRHGSGDRRREAQCVMDRYQGSALPYHIGWDRRPSSLLADWNRMGAYVLSSFAHVEKSYLAARTNQSKMECIEKAVGKKKVATILRNPDALKAKLKRYRLKKHQS